MTMNNPVLEIRKNARLTQKELASLSGVAQPNIAAYERGARRPSSSMLQRLAAAAKPRPSGVLKSNKPTIRRLAKEHKAIDVRVFGSVSRGDDRPGSDLDLLVTFSPDASLFDQVGLAQDLEDVLGIHVDVVSAGGLRPAHAEILAEAKPL